MDWKELLASKVAAGELCREDSTPAPSEPGKVTADTLRVITDRKGRKGKTATIIEGFSCPDEEVAAIASRLKSTLGTGGSSRGGEILIQGDVAQKAKELLKEMGFKLSK